MNATETYQANRLKIEKQIEQMQSLLAKLDEDQKADSKNWGYAGSAEHVSNELGEILNFLWGN